MEEREQNINVELGPNAIMMSLLDLPTETVEHILVHTDPLDVAAFAQTCRLARLLVYDAPDQHLWRALYLAQSLDDPRYCLSPSTGKPPPSSVAIDWRRDLHRIVRARTILSDPGLCRPGELRVVLRTLLDLVRTVPPLPSPSQNLQWIATETPVRRFIEDIHRVHLWSNDEEEEEHQLHAQLHTYFGLTNSDRLLTRRVASRAYVYSMRNCTAANQYGPFMPTTAADDDDDGHVNAGSLRVNWVHVQAIHHAVSMHIVDEYDGSPFPMSLPFTQPAPPPDADGERDWAGLTGIWRCSFCFCSHQELLDYNTSAPPTEPLDNSLFWNPSFPEAFRSLDIKVEVTDTQPDPAHPTRPIIQFAGTVAVGTVMHGYARMTDDNQVRWRSVSEDGGIPVWRCEGVQVGGVGSAFGVLGQWTTVHHEQDDPIGPFWLHKIA